MNYTLEPLAWDSDFFGVAIGRVTAKTLDNPSVEVLLRQATTRGLRCLYLEANPNDVSMVQTLEQHGFHLVDVRVVLEHSFTQRPAPVPRYPIPAELVISAPRADELGQLQTIAAQISLTSRFHFDQNFGPAQSERLYRLWIKNACQGFADVVFIARWQAAGEAVGLITCVLHHNRSHIQLAGVHLYHRQRNVGTGLVQAALDWSKLQGVTGLEVVTQARNVPAQRLYQQMGFFTKSMTLYYHKWLS